MDGSLLLLLTRNHVYPVEFPIWACPLLGCLLACMSVALFMTSEYELHAASQSSGQPAPAKRCTTGKRGKRTASLRCTRIPQELSWQGRPCVCSVISQVVCTILRISPGALSDQLRLGLFAVRDRPAILCSLAAFAVSQGSDAGSVRSLTQK